MSDTTQEPVVSAAVQRRTMLKGTAGILTAGMFPAVHSADPIVLRYLGTAVNQDKEIAEKFEKDVGGKIKIQYVAVTTDDVMKRAITAPNSFDLLDSEYFQLGKLVPTGNLKGIDTKRIKNADKITSVFTTGKIGNKTIGDQGTAPKKVIFWKAKSPRPLPRARRSTCRSSPPLTTPTPWAFAPT